MRDEENNSNPRRRQRHDHMASIRIHTQALKGRAEQDNGSNPCVMFGPSPSLVAELWLVIAERRSSGHSSSSITVSFLPLWTHEWGCHSAIRVHGDVVHALVADDIAHPPSHR
jgi:hypothetical protein